ncbi:hypothetical protein RFI_04251 [Reticulomyxa filosa]|uniref:TB2/DP1, HVA22 family protein n=1 Tax=Reticulomyxa filosa TaxID=46433 RepID=X6P467_RETFI|nr:hypothetical protein RFI_04251 [Reticulomyxa filosa]|eukprot:ETO32864.1 hypothetical protein RFI_04251 [Reticulomyxa filosa]
MLLWFILSPPIYLLSLCEGYLLLILEQVFFWLPVIRTGEVLRGKKAQLYENYISFWFLFGLLISIEFITCKLLFSIPFYSVLRLILVIWAQLDNCSKSVACVHFLTPLLEQNGRLIDTAFETVDRTIKNAVNTVATTAKGITEKLLLQRREKLHKITAGADASKEKDKFQ